MTAYPVASEAMDREIYILSALVCASEKLKSLEGEMRGLAWVRKTFEASELSQRTISLAVILRSHLDSAQLHPNTHVGSLIPDSETSSNSIPLNLREACNKIIHADVVDMYNDNPVSESNGAILNPIILKGSFNGKQWIAEIDILRFLSEASNHS